MSFVRRVLVLVFVTAAAGSTNNGEGSPSGTRQCHWCGPLAEQVHRSRRAAACNEPDQVTRCEPGYEYCAIVATSPPHVESRYCVKIYQDECYPLYCNTTRTWKMTCPCKGDFCNNKITQREQDAFAILAKLSAKTSKSDRIKKRTNSKLMQNDENEIVSNLDTQNKDFMINEMKNVEPTTITLSKNMSVLNQNENAQEIHTPGVNINELMETTLPKDVEPTEMSKISTKHLEVSISVEYPTPALSTKAPEPTQIFEELESTSNIKPTEKLAIESLQQNVTPKSTENKGDVREMSTEETTTDVPTTVIMQHTTKTSAMKNFGTRSGIDLMILTLTVLYF